MHDDRELNLVTLTTLTDANLAELLKNALADEDIECAIDNEHQAGFTGIFPIKVQVEEKDLQRAREILDHHAGSETDDAADDSDEDETEES